MLVQAIAASSGAFQLAAGLRLTASCSRCTAGWRWLRCISHGEIWGSAPVRRKYTTRPRGYIHRNVRAQILSDYVEGEIEACRDAGARVHQSVLNEDPVLQDAGPRLDAAQLPDVFMVSRALASSEEACARGEHAPRAYAHECSGPGMGAQPCDQALRRGIVSIAPRTAGAHEHHDRASRESRRKGSKSAERQAPRGRGAALVGDELQPITSRHDLGGDAKRIGGPGQVQQHNIGQQHEDHVSHGYPSADHRGPLRSGVAETAEYARSVVGDSHSSIKNGHSAHASAPARLHPAPPQIAWL